MPRNTWADGSPVPGDDDNPQIDLGDVAIPDETSAEAALDRPALKHLTSARTDLYQATDLLPRGNERHKVWRLLYLVDELRWQLKRRIG